MSIIRNDEGMGRVGDMETRRVTVSACPRVSTVAPGEGVEPSSSGSKPDVLPVAPSRKTLLIFDF